MRTENRRVGLRTYSTTTREVVTLSQLSEFQSFLGIFKRLPGWFLRFGLEFSCVHEEPVLLQVSPDLMALTTKHLISRVRMFRTSFTFALRNSSG